MKPMKIILPLFAGAFILFIMIFIAVNFLKGDSTRTREPIPPITLNLDTIDFGSTVQDQKVKGYFKTIYSCLEGTLTDQEEGRVLAIVRESKADGTLNQLIRQLDSAGLLKNLVYRWEEEALDFKYPGAFKKILARISGKGLPERPVNQNYENTFFTEIFTFKGLDYASGSKVFSAFNSRYCVPDYTGPDTTNQGLQSSITVLLAKEGISAISRDTRVLFKEAISKRTGTAAFQKLTDRARMTLDTP